MVNIQNMNFIDDREKMHDFLTMSMEDFLNFYSYLEENDYYATYHEIMDMLFSADEF